MIWKEKLISTEFRFYSTTNCAYLVKHFRTVTMMLMISSTTKILTICFSLFLYYNPLLPVIETSFQARAFIPPLKLLSLRNVCRSNPRFCESNNNDDINGYENNIKSIRFYTEMAVNNRGTSLGLKALEKLAKLSKIRLPYKFDQSLSVAAATEKGGKQSVVDVEIKKGKEEGKEEGGDRCDGSDTIIASFRRLLPPSTMIQFLEQLDIMENNGWLSMNPDSVDGLPSLHLNLVSNGKPTTTTTVTEYQKGVDKLLCIVKPYLYDMLLPSVKCMLNSKFSDNDTSESMIGLRISDVFLRRYGQNVCGKVTRNGISTHYDVFSKATAVIALDDVASDGQNGLFTTHISNEGCTSNHAGLRRFFPLRKGDGVFHTWDVLHGVDVEPGLDRTSLIVWFTEEKIGVNDCGDEKGGGGEEEREGCIQSVSPWLANHHNLQTDDIAQFVLASALSSIDQSSLSVVDKTNGTKQDSLEHRLYLSSATKGNTFALTRMGSLVEEGDLSDCIIDEAMLVLERLRPFSTIPGPLQSKSGPVGMSMRFWFEGAVRGNPLAQSTLADELMYQASQSGCKDTRLLAAVFFALSAQQGNESAESSLTRVINYDFQSRGGVDMQNEEDFMTLSVVKTAKAALLT